MSTISKILLIFTLFFYAFAFLFFGMVETTDTWFYWALGNYWRTGLYKAPHPYYYYKPSTMEPPFYSFIMYLVQFLPQSQFALHFVHIFCLLAVLFLLYRILSNYLNKPLSLIISCLFILHPINILYTSNSMSENMALFFVSLYAYVLFKILKNKNYNLIKYLLLLSSIGVLIRYNLIILFFFSIILFLWKKRKFLPDYLLFLISFIILAGWIFANHAMNGAWGLSNATGINLYNRVVWYDQLLPPPNNKNLIKLKNLTPKNFNLRQAWWVIEPEIYGKLNNDETVSSNLYMNVSIDAIKNNPIKYTLDTPLWFLTIHNNSLPIHRNLYSTGPYLNKNCRSLGSIDFCKPVIGSFFSSRIWDFIVSIAEAYYSTLIPLFINYSIFFLALIYALRSTDLYMKTLSGLYLVCSLFVVMVVHPATRYMYPLFTIKILLICFFLKNIRIIYLKYFGHIHS